MPMFHAISDLEEIAEDASGLTATSHTPSLPPRPLKGQSGSKLRKIQKRPHLG